MRPALKRLLPWLIAVSCVAWMLWLFDWQAVWGALKRAHYPDLLGYCIPIFAAIFTVRGLRWLLVLGLRPSWRLFWPSFLANGAAAGLASFTPFQLGEIVKIRLIPDHHGAAWRQAASALLVERGMDLASLCAMGMAGLIMHLGYPRLATLALALPLLGAGVLLLLAPVLTTRLPVRWQPFLEATKHPRRVFSAAILSIPLWALYAALWWAAAHAVNVDLDATQTLLLLGGVMLVIVASLVPGGIGVSELGARSILMWLGLGQEAAETVAIGVRLITPLAGLTGGACALLLLRYRYPPST